MSNKPGDKNKKSRKVFLRDSARVLGAAAALGHIDIIGRSVARVSAASPDDIQSVTMSINTNLGKSLGADFFGLGPVRAHSNTHDLPLGYTDNQLAYAITNTLNPQSAGVVSLRLPPGALSNYYNWQTGGYFPSPSNNPANGSLAYLRNPLIPQVLTADKIAALCQNTGATPTININVLTDPGVKTFPTAPDATNQINMLNTIDNIRYGGQRQIKYIELGNEFYYDIPDYYTVFPNGTSGTDGGANYGTAAASWLSQISGVYPNAQFGVVGIVSAYSTASESTHIPPQPSTREQYWTPYKVLTPLLSAPPNAMTYHMYPAKQCALLPASANSFISHAPDPTAPGDVPLFLSVANLAIANFQSVDMARLDNFNSTNNTHIKAWVTEYNVGAAAGSTVPTPAANVYGRWTHALFIMVLSVGLILTSEVARIDGFSLINDVIDGALFCDTNAYSGAGVATDPTSPFHPPTSYPPSYFNATPPYKLTATGRALLPLIAAMAGATGVFPVAFSSAGSLTVNTTNPSQYPSYSQLIGCRLTHSGGYQFIVVNQGPTPINLSLDTNTITPPLNWEQLHAPGMATGGVAGSDPTAQISWGGDSTQVTSATGTWNPNVFNEATVPLQPYSITRLYP